jgi:hypothetical protein
MSTPARLGLFVAALGVVFGGAFAAGAALGPSDDDQPVSVTTSVPVGDHAGHVPGATGAPAPSTP